MQAKHEAAPVTTEQVAAILERFALARLADVNVNIAAGIALNELRGFDD
jgi:hypothetical protein